MMMYHDSSIAVDCAFRYYQTDISMISCLILFAVCRNNIRNRKNSHRWTSRASGRTGDS